MTIPTLLLALCIVLSILSKTLALADSSGIFHPYFNANHCLEGFQTSPAADTVVFHWGCGEEKYITMECIYDTAGFLDVGAKYAPPGWHCNWPLPPLRLDGKSRVSDVAVRNAGEERTWAACFVHSYGDFSSSKKPYQDTACYRTLLRIHKMVNRTQQDPRQVVKDFLKIGK